MSSGALYGNVTTSYVRCLLWVFRNLPNPKSAILRHPSLVIKRLAAFKSQWIMLF